MYSEIVIQPRTASQSTASLVLKSVFTKAINRTATLTAHDQYGREIPLGNGKKWIWDVDMSANGLTNEDTITSVECSKYGVPSDYMDLLGANPPWNSVAPGFVEGKTARCVGWWQNPSRFAKAFKHAVELCGGRPSKF
jgi:hypothetical protein